MTVETHARKNTAEWGEATGRGAFWPSFCAFRSCSSPILLLLLALSSPCQSVGNERTQPALLPPLPPSALHCALTRRAEEESLSPHFSCRTELPPKRTQRTHTRDPRLNALFSLVDGRMGGQAMLFSALACLSLKPSILFSFPLPSTLFGGSLGKTLRKSPHRSPEKRRRRWRRDLQYNTAHCSLAAVEKRFSPSTPYFPTPSPTRTREERERLVVYSPPLFWAQPRDHHCSAG